MRTAYQVHNISLQNNKVGASHESSIDQGLLGAMVILAQKSVPILFESILHFFIGHGRDGNEVNAKHQGLEWLWDLGRVRCCFDQLALNGRRMGDLE
jgi:hypothetical protein